MKQYYDGTENGSANRQDSKTVQTGFPEAEMILICLVFSTAIPDRVYAQVVPDGTMGTAGEISSTHKQKGGIFSIGN